MLSRWTARIIMLEMDGARWGEYIAEYRTEAADAMAALPIEPVLAISEELVSCFNSWGKLLVAGNGGSAADALHLASEFVNRLTAEFVRPALPAIALNSDVATLTSIGNDIGYEAVFARQVEALGSKGDVLMLISTSGNSTNCLEAAKVAMERGLRVVAVVGGDGGELVKMAHSAFIVPSIKTAHIQQVHLAFYHLLVHIVERELYESR